jgi:alpha-1,3-rhamnosyl/mannosyltransferase
VTTVAMNLLWCRPGVVGGSEEYLTRQLTGLDEIGAPFDVEVYALGSYLAAHPEVARAHRCVTAPVSGARRPVRVLAETTWLNLALRRARVDIVHHGGGTLPLGSPRPSVLTLHDLQWLTYPEYVSRVKLAYLRRTVPSGIRRATVVTAPTAYVAETVAGAYGRDDVVVVPHGIGPDLGRHATPEDELRGRFRLGEGPVVVYPAVTHPHKGHRFLLDLMAGPWRRSGVRLVLIGGRGAAEDDVSAQIASRHLAELVVRAGRVSDDDRDGLVAMAHAVVFPSEYEGFGAPAIEAMALGVPVVASDRAALPEVVGDAGLVRPLELEAWAGALDEVERHRVELVARGRHRVGMFTTAASAAALADAYRGALR